MPKIREGIEIPIVPEDLIFSDTFRSPASVERGCSNRHRKTLVSRRHSREKNRRCVASPGVPPEKI